MWSSLFPSTCLGCGRLVRHERSLAICSTCHFEHLDVSRLPMPDGIVAPFAYQGPLARAVVTLKFGGALALAGPLGRLLADQPVFERDWQLLVPVPLHWRRRWARGFDQAEELARWTIRHRARAHGPTPELAARALRRTRATQPQTDLDAHARAANVHEAFCVREPGRIAGRRVLLLDDVTTTGSTLRACMNALARAGASEVGALTLLRTLE